MSGSRKFAYEEKKCGPYDPTDSLGDMCSLLVQLPDGVQEVYWK
jgi:hypothetical protein